MSDLMRYDIIQRLIDHHGYKSYLEIGIHKGNTWNRIECEQKMGCDPEKHVDDPRIYEMDSDTLFLNCSGNFDIVFIDGLHRAEQVWRDIQNSLKFLNPGGCIVLHDCNPPTLAHAGPEPEIFKKPLPSGEPHFVWCGTVWVAVASMAFYINRNGMQDNFFTVDTDWGVMVIYPYEATTAFPSLKDEMAYDSPEIGETCDINTWNYFDQNRKEILNLISVDEFNRRYPLK